MEDAHAVDMQVQYSQKSVWITLYPICFNRGTHTRLAEYQVRELIQMQSLGVRLEKLNQ